MIEDYSFYTNSRILKEKAVKMLRANQDRFEVAGCGKGYMIVVSTSPEVAELINGWLDRETEKPALLEEARTLLAGVSNPETYSTFKRTAIKFCEENNWDLQIVDDDGLSLRLADEIKDSGWGWLRARAFLDEVKLADDYYYIDTAGNANNILKDTLEAWLEEIITNLQSED